MDKYLRNRLEKELSEIPDISGKEIWIWGAGDTAQLYQEGFSRLKKEGFDFAGYVDKNEKLTGSQIGGKKIFSPDILINKKNICVLICSVQEHIVKDILNQLNEWNIDGYLLDEIILKQHSKEVLQCYDMLEDQKSKEIYEGIIRWRIHGSCVKVFKDEDNTYFALKEFNIPRKEEVFVDCGAYIGDTLKDYVNRRKGVFKKVLSFEIDMDNAKEYQKQADKLIEEWDLKEDSIQLFNYAVGDQMRISRFTRYDNNAGLGSKIIECDAGIDGNCKMVSLDEILDEYNFLKADIESFEYRMLLGAEKGIKKYRPLLAICIYHNAVDLYSIPLLIKKMVPEYKIAIRHHSNDLSETVLYAWV